MTSASLPDLLTCSASELSSFLLEHRFENDGMATAEFLLEGTSTLPNAEAIASVIAESAQANEDESTNISVKKEAVAVVSSTSEESTTSGSTGNHKNATTISSGIALGKALFSSVELALTNPRGKFHVIFHANGIHLTTTKNPIPMVIPAGSVREIIVFPKPSDCLLKTSKTPKSPMILLCFHNMPEAGRDCLAVTFKEKPLSQICFQVPASLNKALVQESHNNDDPTEAWIQLICRSVQLERAKFVYQIHNPSSGGTGSQSTTQWSFKSHQDKNYASTTSGMPYVNCYQGVQDGSLFPMKQGLLFFKPPLFVPRSTLHSIACGRGTGAASRYVDMKVVTLVHDEQSALEFTNIAREELGVLNDYIHNVLIPAMQQDQKTEATSDDGTNNSDDDDDCEQAVAVNVVDDNDNHVEVDVKGTRGRSKRKAAQAARQQTKQHFLQANKATNDDDDGEEDSEDDDAFHDGDDDEEDEDDHEYYEDSGAKGKSRDDSEENSVDGDDDGAVEVEEDLTDADETEEDDDASPPPTKKPRQK